MIYIVSGGVGAGKTTFLSGLASRLAEGRVPLSGFRSERVYRGDEIFGYDLVDLASGARTAWLRLKAGRERIGPFAVVPRGLSAATAIIQGSPPAGILAVDELGPAELEGRGFWPALRPLLEVAGRSFLFVVRTACLPGFETLLAGRPTIVFRVGSPLTPEDAAREILAHGRQG